MRFPFAAALTFLAACAALPHATIRTSVEDRVRIDGLSGEELKLLNEGPDELVFELQREKGPPQVVKIGPGLAWGVALEGLRAIIVSHEGEGAGRFSVTVRGRTGSGIRVVPLPKE